MTATELLVDCPGNLLRAAILEHGRLTGLHLDRRDWLAEEGAVFLGRVARVMPALGGAFVNLGFGRAGFLTATDLRPILGPDETVADRLADGRPILVQIKAAGTGNKGPALTMDIALPGRFLVHAPFSSRLTVSRRIAHRADRTTLTRRIQALAPTSGWIVRAAAAMAADGSVATEAEALAVAWHSIVSASQSASAPTRLASGADAARRALIDLGATMPTSLIADGEPAAQALGDALQISGTDLMSRFQRHHSAGGSAGLFDSRNLESAIDRLRTPRVSLGGGGWLMIEPTEALTAIDVNGGDRGHPFEINREAATEIARQLRLRNLGGIMVIDFVSMKSAADRERLIAVLTASVADDPVQTQVYGISKLGLVEATRARRGRPLADLIGSPPSAPAR